MQDVSFEDKFIFIMLYHLIFLIILYKIALKGNMTIIELIMLSK